MQLVAKHIYYVHSLSELVLIVFCFHQGTVEISWYASSEGILTL